MSKIVEYTDEVWRGLNMRELNVDEAYIVLKSRYNTATFVYGLSEECYTCPYTKLGVIYPNITKHDENVLRTNVAHMWNFKVHANNIGPYSFNDNTPVCQLLDVNMREFGVYNITITEQGKCEFVADKEGVNIYWSITLVFILVLILIAAVKVGWYTWCKLTCRIPGPLSEPSNISHPLGSTIKRGRMRSLDVFRGLSIVLMIFVNSGGGSYWWIEHATWNGLHLADVVFPSFIWIMGTCIPISVRSQIASGTSKAHLCKRIIWRSLKLLAIGICLNSINGPSFENIRFMGVLQRFSIAYLVGGLLHTILCQRDMTLPQESWRRYIFDLLQLKWEILVMLSMIMVHLAIVFGLNVPECPTGYLGPGGKADDGLYKSCIGGATGFIDKIILGPTHIYQHTKAKYIYESQAFDPEGIFGSLLTIVQVILGIICGMIILTYNQWLGRIQRWLIWSFVLALLSGILCGFSKENGMIPINKNLWSLSFVCLTTSLNFFLLSILYLVVDVCRWWSGTPFVEAGMNSILMYVGHTVTHKMLPWHWRFGSMNTHLFLLLECTWNTLLWIVIAVFLDYKHFYYTL